jgi:ureidoglycolate lyase
MRLEPRPLTARDFTPFGDVIEASDAAEQRSINAGHSTRFHDLARLTLDAEGGTPCLSIFRTTPLPQPLHLTMMERHPLSSQAFHPLGPHPYLVVVAPPGEFRLDAVRAFLARPGQGVNYHPGTWHHFNLALGGPSDFLVVDRDGPGTNCDEITLAEPMVVETIVLAAGDQP